MENSVADLDGSNPAVISQSGAARFRLKVRPGKQIKETNFHLQRETKVTPWDELEQITNVRLTLTDSEPGHPAPAPAAVLGEDPQASPAVSLTPSMRPRPRWHLGIRKESFILLVLLIETCIVTADYYMPVFEGRRDRTESAAVADHPKQVVLHFINSAPVPVQVRVNNHWIALGKNESFQKKLPTGMCHISWWREVAGSQSKKCLTKACIAAETDWDFELTFAGDKPVVLRTSPDQESKSASPVE